MSGSRNGRAGIRQLFFVLVWLAAAGLQAGALVGKAAPELKLPGSDGKVHSLKAYKGKTVVLEWLNQGCPFVRKHYDSGNMQALQKEQAAKGVVWLSVVSSAPGREGYFKDAAEAMAFAKESGGAAQAILLDPQGKVGRAYGAKATPHMVVIDKQGKLAYMGAIDDRPSTNKDDVQGAKNYVRQALDELAAGKAVSEPETKAYGCSVKYAD